MRALVSTVLGIVALAAPAFAQTYRDGDLERLRISDPATFAAVQIEETSLAADGLTIPLTTLRNSATRSNTFYFVMHDEEDEAFEAMAWAVATFGGTGLAVENGDRRNVGGRDLNELFARAAWPELNAHFETLVRASDLVIALHNNYNHPRGTMYLTNTRYFGLICNAGDDIDDVLITGQIGASANFCARTDIAAMVSKSLNIANASYQDRRGAPFDCERGCNFQRFVISHFGVRYFNLEAEHDNGSTQQKLQLCAILDPDGTNAACAALG